MIINSNYVCRARGRNIYAKKYTNVFMIKHKQRLFKVSKYNIREYASGFASIGTIFVSKEHIGKRFRLKVEWIDE